MFLIDRLEYHLALPGDDDTHRKRKVAAFLAGLLGLNTALVFAIMYFAGGVPILGWLYIMTVVWTFTALAVLIARPRTYFVAALLTTIYVTIHPWVVVVASGGYQSGLLPMLWALVGPAASVVLIGIRPAIFNAVLYVILAATAIYLDPIAAASAPPVPDWVRLTVGLISAIVPGMMVVFISLFLFRQVERARVQADQLLLNILPAPVADRLKENQETIAEGYDDVTVLFADIVDFTHMSSGIDACDVVDLLNAIFSDFDVLAGKYGLEKIKTVGDAYMVVGGLPEPKSDHIEAVMAFAVEALDVVRCYQAWNGDAIRLRIGIHTGAIVAGVIGRRKFIYDLWGDTVNTASRMESYGIADRIQVTAAVRDKLASQYEFIERSPIHIKGKGVMVTYLYPAPGMEQNTHPRSSES